VKDKTVNRESQAKFAALVGIDWADKEHHVCMRAGDGGRKIFRKLPQKSEDIAEWAAVLHTTYPGQQIAVAIEQSKGAVVYALMKYDFLTIFPINPVMLAKFRQAFTHSRAKDDPTDADLLCELLLCHRDKLRAWKPDSKETRRLQILAEHRRKAVNLRSQLTNRLLALLKIYFPQAIELCGSYLFAPVACDLLAAWPTLDAIKRAKTETIRKFYYAHNIRKPETIEQRLKMIAEAHALTIDNAIVDTHALAASMVVAQLRALHKFILKYDQQIARTFADHEDAYIFASFPGAAEAMAPRLLAAFGADRDHFAAADEVQKFSGIAPVTERSGQSEWVHRRWSAPKFILQTFHEYANISIRYSVWARSLYEHLREKGKGHHAAIRVIAFKWIRIMFRCWKDRTSYDELAYIKTLQKRGSYLFGRIQQA
jgi:transposase